MIEINITDNLHVIGWIILAFVHVGFVWWFSWGISEYLKDSYDRSFYVMIGIVLPAVILLVIWLGMATEFGHIVWL